MAEDRLQHQACSRPLAPPSQVAFVDKRTHHGHWTRGPSARPMAHSAQAGSTSEGAMAQ